jgi:hypothetical protein
MGGAKSILLIAAIVLGLSIIQKLLWSGQENMTEAGEYKISNPYMHKNLTIFLIHGQDKLKGKIFLTLQEAMEKKLAIVHETENVNELTVENVSKDIEIYLQAGDIVKGGKQDRVMAVDIILPPKSGKMPVASFCVEQGRWSQRGQESKASFSKSADQISSKKLKLAVKKEQAQGEVWEQVSSMQNKLKQNLGQSVASQESESSLQLTLENKKVQEAVEDYIENLINIISDKSDVIGFIFAINGEINSGDVYVSNNLFKKLWPKLLKSSAVEAVADFQKDKKFPPVIAETVAAFLSEVENGKVSEKEITDRIKMVSKETEQNIFFETNDLENQSVWIHRNYIKK